MFTSEPSLAQRIGRMIGDTPIIDSHSRVRPEKPGAPDLATLIAAPPVLAELIAVGMGPRDLDPTLPPDERVRRSIPFLARMRNTATAWSLFRIFRDLYDFADPHLDASNYRGLFDKVLATADDPAWAPAILRDRCKIVGVVTGLGDRQDRATSNPGGFAYRLDLDFLLCPGDAARPSYFDTLTALLGEAPTTTERLERLVFDWLGRTIQGPVKLAAASLPIGYRFKAPDETYTQFVLNQAGDDWDVSDAEVDVLSRAVSWAVLKWHHGNRKVFQVSVGSEGGIGESPSLPRSGESWTSEMARTFREFGKVRFDLILESDMLAPDVAALAARLPNVYASGYRSHNASPMAIEKNVGLRVQVAPMTKIGGFLSDADSAEWTYGRLQVVKKATASALARLVEAGYFEEDEIPPLLRQVLHDTPRDLYGLGGD